MFEKKKEYIRWDRLLDEVERWAGYHVDDQETPYVRNMVQVTLRELFREQYQEALWVNGGLVTIATNVDAGADEYGYHELGSRGEADIVADNTTDLPTADIKGDYTVKKVQTVATSFEYSTQDVRKARLQGMWDVATEKAGAARQVYDRKLDNLIHNGAKAYSLDGITNLPDMRVEQATNGTWISSSRTGAQITADISAAVGNQKTNTQNVETPNTFACPSGEWLYISTIQNSASSDATILDYLKKAFPMITRWVEVPKMSTASEAGAAAALLYRNDRTRVRGIMPMAIRPLPPEARGLVFKVNLESRWGGIISPKPLSLTRLEGI